MVVFYTNALLSSRSVEWKTALIQRLAVSSMQDSDYAKLIGVYVEVTK